MADDDGEYADQAPGFLQYEIEQAENRRKVAAGGTLIPAITKWGKEDKSLKEKLSIDYQHVEAQTAVEYTRYAASMSPKSAYQLSISPRAMSPAGFYVDDDDDEIIETTVGAHNLETSFAPEEDESAAPAWGTEQDSLAPDTVEECRGSLGY